MILNDQQIIARCVNTPMPMISHFADALVREVPYKKLGMDDGERAMRRVISYGLSSFGYDIRLSPKDLKVFTNLQSAVIDPRKMDPRVYTAPEIRYDEEDDAAYVLLPPNTGMIGHTIEYFQMPADIIATCLGKSTYARALVSVIVTPLEPGWCGNLVVEIVNHTNSPVRIYPEQGIAQLNFFQGQRPNTTYADRGGKYQGQVGTQDAMV